LSYLAVTEFAVSGESIAPPKPLRVLRLAAAISAVLVLGPTLLHRGRPDASEAFERVDTGGLPELRSRDGVLAATLTAAPLAVHIGGAVFAGAAFNGVYGGPVLRVHPGDRVELHLINHMTDAINLHFHGLRISPLGRGDNMRVLVPPGQSYDYSFGIPADHPAGLYWYHDHAHGAAEAHVMAGLSGALLIEGFARQFGGLAGVAQRLLVVKDWQNNGCGGGMLKTALHCRVISINGAADWPARLAPGETQLWRISNQGANQTIHLEAPHLSWRLIGRDSLPVSQGLDSGGVDILPAGRADVLVRADTEGAFPLDAVGVPTTSADGFSIRRALGSINVSGASQAARPEVAIPAQPDMRRWRIDARREIGFSENADSGAYYINGRTFDPHRIDFTIPLGHVEAWTIRNETDDFHAFHIHQVSFQVDAINGAAQRFTGYIDTVEVPPRGAVRLIIPFTDPKIVGHIMFHCHVLNHEDHGMMAMLEVTRTQAAQICRAPPGE
jgi:FtsP/CotA-like multicopper oxidase with cupredoxin domain